MGHQSSAVKSLILVAVALLALVPMTTSAQARARRAADLAIVSVTVASAHDGRATVRFTVVNRGGKRSRAATIRATIGKASASLRQKPLKPHRRQRRSLTVKR